LSDVIAQETAYRRLWDEAQHLIRDHLPELRTFLPPQPERPEFTPILTKDIAPLADLAALPALTTAPYRKLVDTLIELRRHLAWTQTYSKEDGLQDGFLDRYGYICLSGPDAPLRVDDSRLFIGYWGAGLEYPMHAHAPSEIYATLAGSARFSTPGAPDRTVEPGDCVVHEPWQPHAMVFRPGPYLCLAGWLGPDLSVTPRFLK
jgi:mannose-6-phosphate isomerase-like protein (cupin superfamily)